MHEVCMLCLRGLIGALLGSRLAWVRLVGAKQFLFVKPQEFASLVGSRWQFVGALVADWWKLVRTLAGHLSGATLTTGKSWKALVFVPEKIICTCAVESALCKFLRGKELFCKHANQKPTRARQITNNHLTTLAQILPNPSKTLTIISDIHSSTNKSRTVL